MNLLLDLRHQLQQNKTIGILIIITMFGFNLFSKNNKNDEELLPVNILHQISDTISVKANLDVSYFDKFLKIYPSSDFLIGMKGYYLCFNVSKDSCLKYLETNIKKYPNLKNGTFFNLSLAVAQSDNTEKEFFLLKSISLDKNKTNQWVRLELYYFYDENKSLINALKYLNECFSINPFFSIALVEKSNILMLDGKSSEAIIILTSVINKYPTYMYALLNRAEIYFEIKDYNKALCDYQSVYSLDKENISAILGLAKVNTIWLKDYIKTEVFCNIILAKDSLNNQALIMLGSSYINQKKYDKAISVLEKALIIKSSYETYSELIYAFILSFDFKEAEITLASMTEKYGEDRLTDFFEILINHLNADKKTAEIKINDFYSNYGEEDKNWLKEQLAVWNVSIKN